MEQPFRLLIFLNQPYMFRETDSHILRSILTVYTVRSAPEDGRICRPKHVALI